MQIIPVSANYPNLHLYTYVVKNVVINFHSYGGALDAEAPPHKKAYIFYQNGPLFCMKMP